MGNNSIYQYNKGHPCYGCPYVFPTDKPSCVFGSCPGECFWYFYNHKRGMSEGLEKKGNRIRDREIAADKINQCIEMLEEVMFKKGYLNKDGKEVVGSAE